MKKKFNRDREREMVRERSIYLFSYGSSVMWFTEHNVMIFV